MSHFVTLLENALKAGNAHDPAYRKAMYKGALRAFDKMSDQREDRAEFRKLHGPQLADAITKIEQRYVVLEDDELQDHNAANEYENGEPEGRFAPDISATRTMAADQALTRDGTGMDPSFDSTVEPPTADYGDFDLDDTSTQETGAGALIRKFGLWIGAVLGILVLVLVIWMFV